MDHSIRNRLAAGFVAMLVVILGGTLGYWVVGEGRWTLFDCLYMTIITITTVGYGETLVGMDTVRHARTLTIVLLVFGTGVLVYFASTITAFIVEGDLRRALATGRLRKRIKKMKDHVIVCGAGTTGRHIIAELLKIETPVVAIDTDEEALRELAEKHPGARYTYLVGDATDDEVLAAANLASARGIVAALAGDKDNLYLVVAARQQSASVRIVARCVEVGHIERLKRAGADGVVSPNFIGGMRMVSEMVRPSVVRFLDDMMRDKRAAYRVEEVTVAAGSTLAGKSLYEADVRRRFGMSVIALRGAADEQWTYNPEASARLGAGMVLVVVGNTEQVATLRAAASPP